MSVQVERNTFSSLQELTDQSVVVMEVYLENIRNQAWNYFSDEALQNYVSQMDAARFNEKTYYRDKLSMLIRTNTLLHSISLYDLKGSETNNPLSIPFREEDRETVAKEKEQIIRTALANDGVAEWEISRITGIEYGQLARTISYVQALKKISSYQQTMVGVLRIDLNPEPFQKLLHALKINYEGEFYLVNGEGTILMAENNADVGNSLEGSPLFRTYRGSAARQGHFTLDSKDGQWVGFYHHFESTDWAVLGKIPMAQVLTSMNRVKNYTLVIGLISLIIAMAIAYAVAFNVTRPLRTLRQSMQQIEAGNFDISVTVGTRDEIGYLQLTFNKMAKQIRRLITEVYRTELLKKEAEIKALQSQINPHFLYNTLGTIDSLAAIRGDKEISWISQSLGNMFRYNISGGTVATIGEEVGQIRQYLSIQQVRYKDRLTYDIRIGEELENVRIPKLLLQPIVENAIIHGVEHRRERGIVRIYTEIADERDMRLMVEDNGAGMTDEQLKIVREALLGTALPGEAVPERGTFIGLINVNQRIKLFYGDRYGIEIDRREGGGTIVSFLLPRHGMERVV